MRNVSATRRQFLLQASAASAILAQKPRNTRPNVLLITSTDLSAWMLGIYGNQEFHTPNIDRLARGGVRFTNAYACAPADSPSRATLFTGRTPFQHGVQESLSPQAAAPPSLGREPLLSDLLAAQGYHCGFAGAWGLGGDQNPQHKFDSWCATLGAGYRNPRLSVNGQTAEESGYLPDVITRKANEFLDAQRPGQPFFLTVSYPNPAAPYDGHPQKYYDLYAGSKFDAAGWDRPSAAAATGKEYLANPVASIRKCAAGVTALDDQIPALIAKLTGRGLRDDTLVILTSTNGNLLGRHGLWGDGRASEPVNMYDEVVKVPLIWNWPGRTPVEAMRPELVSLYDVVPSVCEAASVSAPAANLCGRSMLPLATGRPLPKKEPWRTSLYGMFRNTFMARDTRYKLVYRDDGKGACELFDLRGDMREKLNQYSNPQFVTVRDRLVADLSNWRAKYAR
ncbi:MAG: sulfatase-like hydrolase/transferase [Acidobacteria bacterium]|nr:sulfatase-like hydrolase/transferase [Acidobacteriota bacterium]